MGNYTNGEARNAVAWSPAGGDAGAPAAVLGSRLVAGEAEVSLSTVQRIWRDHRLQPHRTRSFKFSTGPRLLEKVTDVVGLYLHPPGKALVLCVDEKSQIQAPGSHPTAAADAARPGRAPHPRLKNLVNRSDVH